MLGLATLPVGCVTTTGGAGTETRSAICDQFKPIRWSIADTDATIAQAKENNAVGTRICRWKP